MIFAELEYNKEYSDIHKDLVDLISSRFSNIQYGLQGDSWIWVFADNDKVEIDTFSSMKHQIKSSNHNSQLVQKVIDCLASKYKVTVYNEPELEAHEE